MFQRPYRPGDFVIYRTSKAGSRPGPRAIHLAPAIRGEYYQYQVDKYWIVAEARHDGQLLLRTRRGKMHLMDAHHPQLRHATLWDRLRYGHRFPGMHG